MAGVLVPVANALQFFTNAGAVLASGKINTYLAGTTTPQTTYKEQGLSTAHANPIVLDANGRLASPVWVDSSISLKLTFTTSADVAIGPTFDDIQANSFEYVQDSTNTAFGTNALDSVTSGTNNTAFGADALTSITTASNNTAVGFNALKLATGAQNTAIGSGAGDAITTGTTNLAVGYNALSAVTTAGNNVAIGASALAASTASNNVAIGTTSLDSNTTGTNNMGVGYDSLGLNTTGSQNTALGALALRVATTADDNVAIGYASGLAVTTGAGNTCVGRSAGDTITTGANNTCVGGSADVNSATASNRTVIGVNAVGTVDDTVNLGAQSHNVAIGGATALATTATAGFLYVPTCAGAPTGTPTTITARAPIVVDSTTNKLYFYSGGAWRDAGP